MTTSIELADNGIVAKNFLDIDDNEIESELINVSFGGRKILKKLLRELKVTASTWVHSYWVTTGYNDIIIIVCALYVHEAVMLCN